MITREEWGARPRQNPRIIEHSYRTGVVIHHSVTATGDSQKDVEAILRQIDAYHIERDMGGIGYNLCVDYAGRIYVGRGLRYQGAHVVDNNARNYGICYIGDGRNPVPKAAVAGIKKAVNLCRDRAGHKLAIKGHQDLWPTACPGDNLMRLVNSGAFRP
jgi:hypothetical protein